MKRMRMFFIVIIMLCISIFAFVSQGEELANRQTSNVLLSPSQRVGFTGEINQIQSQMASHADRVLKASTMIKIEPDRAILNQEIGALQYRQDKKTNTYSESRAVIYDEALEERVQIILELTPLDADTAKVVLKYADRYDIRPSLILSIMDLESNFGQYLVGTSQDRGYMQIIPGTEKWLATAYGDELGLSYNPDNIFDADYNIPLAVKYLAVLRSEYGNNDTKILTSYNRGDAGLYKWYEEHGTYETAYSRIVLKREKKYLEVK